MTDRDDLVAALTTSAARFIAAVLRDKVSPEFYEALLIHLRDIELEAAEPGESPEGTRLVREGSSE